MKQVIYEAQILLPPSPTWRTIAATSSLTQSRGYEESIRRNFPDAEFRSVKITMTTQILKAATRRKVGSRRIKKGKT